MRLICAMLVLIPLAGCAGSEAVKRQTAYHYQMGIAYLGEDNVTRALVELTEAEKYTPDDPELLNHLGIAYFRKKKYDIAEQKYLQAIALKPSFSNARNNLGVAYMEMKRWDDAIRQFKLVTEDIFFNAQDMAAINLGLAYLGKGDYEQALAVLRSAVSTYPADPNAHLSLGRVYFAMEKTGLAIGEFRRAIELNRNYANAYYQLGIAHLKQKHNEAARDAFKEVVRLVPESEIGQLSREKLDLLK